MNKMFSTVLFALLLFAGILLEMPSLADIGPSMNVDINEAEHKIKNLVVLSQYNLELPGNPQKPAIDKKGNFALIPAKDLDILYYVSMIKGYPVLLKYTIPTGKAPVDVVISDNSRRAYVANELDDTISLIDLHEEDSQVKSVIKVGDRPHSLALSKDGKYLYVVNRGEDTLFVLDIDKPDCPIVNKIKVGEWPNSIKISNNGKLAFVVNRGGNTVTEVNLYDPLGAVLKEDIIVGTYPIDIAISSDNNVALVTNALDNNIGIFSPVESVRVMFGNISQLAKPFGIASDYINNIAIAITYNDNKIHYFDLSDSKSKVVSELKHTDTMITEKPEYVVLNSKPGVILISHPKRDNLTVINFKVEEEIIKLKPKKKELMIHPEPVFKENMLKQEQEIIPEEQAKGQSNVSYPQNPQVQQAEDLIEDFDADDEE